MPSGRAFIAISVSSSPYACEATVIALIVAPNVAAPPPKADIASEVAEAALAAAPALAAAIFAAALPVSSAISSVSIPACA